MPWRGADYPGEFPSLGWLVGEWIEGHCVVPDGNHAGEPYKLTDEMWRYLAWHYRLRPDAVADPDRPRRAWLYRRSQLVRPQKWGKGPFSAAATCAEAEGPVLFDGWDAYGEPVGRPWATPWIQITAASEGQTDNVWRALQPMIELGPLADLIPDTGETRINLPGGGRIEPVTASARSRLGQRITFAVQDETHSWLESNGGWRLAETQRRNLAGMGGRSMETSNGWDPSEQSVAQRTAESAVKDVYRDHTVPKTLGSIGNRRELRRMLREVYGDSWWVDIDGILGDFIELAEKDPRQAERFFLNRIVSAGGTWLDRDRWDGRAAPRPAPPAGTAVVLGFDGSDIDDWTAIRAETREGYQFTPRVGPARLPAIWNPADYDGQVPRLEVGAAVDELFGYYRVIRMYGDPPYWETELDTWAERHGDKRVLRWATKRAAQMHDAAERLITDVLKADSGFSHDGCPITSAHVGNARKAARPAGRYVLAKASDAQKIDSAVTSVLAHEAAGDATAAGLWTATESYAYSA
jgi:hypothetical protein